MEEIIGTEVEYYGEEEAMEFPRGDMMGFSFKRLVRKVAKPIGKVTRFAVKSPLINPIKTVQATARIIARNPIAAVMPPVGAFMLLRDAMKKRPAAVAKVEAIKEAATGGNPVAQQAFENMVMANEVQKQGVAPEQVFPEYPPEDMPYEEYMTPDAQYAVDPGEYDGAQTYVEGEGVDVVAGLWSKLKKLGPALDFTNPKNPIRSAVASIPLVGSGVIAAGDMLAKAKSGAKDALSKIDEVKKLAAGGNPTAQQALANLHTANAIDKAAEQGTLTGMRIFKRLDWFPGISTYRDGMRKGIEIKDTGPDKAPGWKPGGV